MERRVLSGILDQYFPSARKPSYSLLKKYNNYSTSAPFIPTILHHIISYTTSPTMPPYRTPHPSNINPHPSPSPLLPSPHSSKLRHNRPPPHGQRNPPPNQAQAPQRRNRPQHLEPLRIQDEQVYRAGEHGHARCKETHCDCVLRRDD